ncbi:penicillin-binding protein 2 [Algoriella xinjiangensis]|uniref:Penicillin-binding protein 2 n=1 Tax=Algoriella xinjiangensis TaxID=684065 RepID=A0A1I4TFE1_9FLAO|nr:MULTISPECIES: penicillin-binding transpeptidase domain-containing protein [Algoriella]MBO6213777.1 peptidoglycan glycosyltransferase [Algoriella sp.]SFM75371.1 penicillin-binding protein 2 [Algoriella xinjiangensis]
MKKLMIVYALILFIVCLFIGRLAYLQLFTDRYTLNAFNTSIKQEIVYPNRGDILDRNGKLLVSNTYSYELDVIPGKVINDSGIAINNFDKNKFANMVGISPLQFDSIMNKIVGAKDYKRLSPYPFIKNISRENFARMQEQLYLYPAFSIIKRPERKYMVSSAGNILGYINEAGPAYIKTDSTYYQPGDLVGIAGVEKSYEKDLRGIKGVKNWIVDRTMNVVGPYKNGEYDRPVKSGKTVNLTIDFRLQELAEQMLKNKRGAIVALDPSTGEILALASAPTINPNDFLDSKLRNKLINDSISRPTYDRALQGSYPPGSTFKLMTALAGMQMGTMSEETTYVCKHGFRYGRMKIGCHCGMYFTPQGLEHAIGKSCNNYFSEAYRDIVRKDPNDYSVGMNQWAAIMNSFGLGKFMGTDLPVGSKGLIPTSEFYDNRFGEGVWNPYRIIFNGMGQGDVNTTPLQMANFVAAIGNKGFFYTPHIVRQIDGKSIKDSTYTTKKHTLVDPKHFDIILRGMHNVFTMGTGRGFAVRDFEQLGKTGTAQNSQGQDHSLFVLLAPADKPKIAIAAIIENGHYGATWAGPMTSLVAELYITDTIKRPALLERMKNGNLNGEYNRQWVNYLKKKGLYIEPVKKDSVINKADSLKLKKVSTKGKNEPKQIASRN